MNRTSSAAQREIRRTSSFIGRQQEAVASLLRTTNMVERHLATVVEPHDITLHQYTVLRILREAGEALPTMAIAERMIEQTPGITRMLDRLERKGLVRRDRDGNDRRQVLCNITDAGRALVDHLHEPMSTADEAVLSTLTEDQLTSLLHMLDSIRGNCG